MSSPLELWRPLFCERPHSFVHVFCREEKVKVPSLELKSFVEWCIESLQNCFLCKTDRDWCFLGDLQSQFLGFAEVGFERDYFADKSVSLCFSRRNRLARQDHLHGTRFSHCPCKSLCTACT